MVLFASTIANFVLSLFIQQVTVVQPLPTKLVRRENLCIVLLKAQVFIDQF